MSTRRVFISAALAAAPVLAAAPERKVAGAGRVISVRPEYYHGWPTVASRRSGELLAVCSGGRETHVCPFGRVELIRSHDRGRTWTWPEILMDSAIDDRDAGVVETPSGSILVTTFTSLAYEAALNNARDWPRERLERWQAANDRLSPQRRRSLLGTWMLRSSDEGMTWSAPYRVPVNSPHGPATLTDGRMLYAGKQLWDPGAKVGVCLSDDDGRTWGPLSEISPRPGDTVGQYHELHAVDAGSGTILVHIRNHNPRNAGETLQCESSDGGKSWTMPHSIGAWGLPSHLLRLRDGRILMTYGYRRVPFGIQARTSEDAGRTWSAPLVLADDGANSDLGYPSSVEVAEGRLITIWYERPGDSPRAVLRQLEWSLS